MTALDRVGHRVSTCPGSPVPGSHLGDPVPMLIHTYATHPFFRAFKHTVNAGIRTTRKNTDKMLKKHKK